ncbi:hypothetical protein CU098_012275 [Rhizopus stolonifer]|uniref:Protein kinase domain-containing protein n=1 Tax=Rhizopus stolonifer TaxID=4846 RepID=A0A367KUZ0_RHIST|nr:hypothetical protein CU098_012275 [Rhizopus stolonifer]
MGQTQSKQGLKEEDVSELIRCSSDLSISDRSHTSIKDKAKKKKGLDLHQGVFYGGIKKKRFYKASNSETIRNHNQVPSSSGPVIGMSLYSKISVANFRKDKNIQHAVKMIRKESFVKKPEILKQFMQEVAILMSLEKHVSNENLIYFGWYNDDSASIHDKILSGSLKYCEEMSVWNSLSLSARRLIENLLKVKPEERLTAAEALDDPWITFVPYDI